FLVRGVALGAALGFLKSMGLLVLASHYKNNVALASMQSGFAALTGAAIYTPIIHFGLSRDNTVVAGISQFGISLGTLMLASCMIRRSRRYDFIPTPETSSSSRHHQPTTQKSHLIFTLSYFPTFSALFIYPTFFPLLFTSAPSVSTPLAAILWSTCSLLAGAVSAAYFTSDFCRHRLGPVNTYIAFCILAGLALVNPAWMPYPLVLGPACVVYCVCLGPLLGLCGKVPMVL
ncbi:hypothetical protein CC80DRAFT_387915, partial [Byssothecium circinans]